MSRKGIKFGVEIENKIRWCFKQNDGIKIVEPNENLSKAYMKEADGTLISMASTVGKWKIIMAYYACYNALYSILIKAGIKSEIHTCTLVKEKLLGDYNAKK